MRDNKAFASLSSGLLARKGQARPAMRPQGFGQGLGQPDDLGWNDMGHDVQRAAPSLPPVTPPVVSALPEVIRQQDVIAREFAAEPVVAPAVVATSVVVEPVVVEPVADVAVTPPVGFTPAKQPRRKSDRKAAAPKPSLTVRPATRKAAFTLRLDSDRHLLLRLSCAVQNRSAQQIVIEALDRLLADQPDVARLAASLPDKN